MESCFSPSVSSPTRPVELPPQPGSHLRQWAEVILSIFLTVVVVEFVRFREDRSFWLDGSSSARLRSFVCEMFYPVVWMQTALLIRITWGAFVGHFQSIRLGLAQPAIILLLWLAHAASLLFAVQNNVVNVLQGRPLHWHADALPAHGGGQEWM